MADYSPRPVILARCECGRTVRIERAPRLKPWRARALYQHRRVTLGWFKTREEAEAAEDRFWSTRDRPVKSVAQKRRWAKL